jgi:cyclohexanone monooxygenase
MKRPALSHHYLGSFNKPHIHLVDERADLIESITPSGIRKASPEYEVHVVIYTLGFEAVAGPLTGSDLRGKNDQLLKTE